MSQLKPHRLIEPLIILLVIIPWIIALYAYPYAPETVPIHWNFEGNADNWADKSVGLFLMPIVILILYFFLRFIPYIDPNKEKIAQSIKLISAIRLAVHTFLAIIVGLTTFSIIGSYTMNNSLVFILIVCLMTVMGKFMVGVKQNYFFGIRTPWTLANEQVWSKTHALGGNLWYYSGLGMIGLLTILSVLHIPDQIIITVFFSWIGFIVAVPLVYSYVYYRKLKKNIESENKME